MCRGDDDSSMMVGKGADDAAGRCCARRGARKLQRTLLVLEDAMRARVLPRDADLETLVYSYRLSVSSNILARAWRARACVCVCLFLSD